MSSLNARTRRSFPGVDVVMVSVVATPSTTLVTVREEERPLEMNTITISPEHDLVVVWRWHRGNEAEFVQRVISAIRR